MEFIESVTEENRIGAPFRVHFPSFCGSLGRENVIDEIIETVKVEIIQAILETMHGTFIYSTIQLIISIKLQKRKNIIKFYQITS